jgi:hypothetical protein
MTDCKEKFLNKVYENTRSLYSNHLQPGLVEGEAAYRALRLTIESHERIRHLTKAG